MLHLFIAATCT